MQRAAASESPSLRPHKSSILPSSPSSASTPDSDSHSAKRRKFSSDTLVSKPSPLTPGPRPSFLEDTPSKYAQNAAEIPWILDASGHLQDIQNMESPTQEDEEILPTGSPPVGRRRFGQFKEAVQSRSSARPRRPSTGYESSSSSAESAHDYRRKSSTYGKARGLPVDNVKSPKSRHRDDQSRLDRISGKRIRSGGISAAAGR